MKKTKKTMITGVPKEYIKHLRIVKKYDELMIKAMKLLINKKS